MEETMTEFYFKLYKKCIESAESDLKSFNEFLEEYKKTNDIGILIVACSDLDFAIKEYKSAQENLSKAGRKEGWKEVEKLSGGEKFYNLEIQTTTKLISLEQRYYENAKLIVDYIIDNKISL